MSGYCDFAPGHALHGPYHDREYGFPLAGDDALFERLILEINQAGLSWELMLKKRESFRAAYAGFAVAKVAKFGAKDTARLLADPGIVRNKLKVAAAIHNAKVIVELAEGHGSFDSWLASHHPKTKKEWVKLFGKTFKFTGGEIVGEFLMSVGYLPGAHRETCAAYKRILKTDPPWRRAAKSGFAYV
jgi:DNA-3-methyladenine glycosylase I